MVLFVDRAAVLGAGVMGARIAEVLALNNVNVTLRDIDDAAIARGMTTIEQDLDELVRFHAAKAPKAIEDFEEKTGVKLTDEQKAKVKETLKPTYDEARKKRVLSKIKTTTSFDGFDKVELVIEAAPENPALKKKIFQELVTKVGDHCVIATNTSTLSVSDLASALPPERRGRFLGVHFFNPPTTLPLIAVIPGIETRADIVEDLLHFLAPLCLKRFPP